MNTTIKVLMKDRVLVSSPHKCAIIWSTKIYRIVNRILRTNKTIANLDSKTYKYTKRFLDEFLIYFRTFGIMKDELHKECGKLYRGYKSLTVNHIRDYTFMSTSKSKHVAEGFAGKDGVIISLSTSKLPENVPFVIIDQRIREYLLEDEVLLLPGTISLEGRKGIYSVDQSVYEYMLQLTHKGGEPKLEIKLPDIDLKGKYVVWWRAIQNRPVEILTIIRLPWKSDKQVIKFWRECIDPKDCFFEDISKYIPTYQDLFNKTNRTIEENKELDSYNVYMAIYDKKQSTVEHFHYGIFDGIADELGYDKSREKEVEKLVKTSYMP